MAVLRVVSRSQANMSRSKARYHSLFSGWASVQFLLACSLLSGKTSRRHFRYHGSPPNHPKPHLPHSDIFEAGRLPGQFSDGRST
jgi:hypothetical protein